MRKLGDVLIIFFPQRRCSARRSEDLLDDAIAVRLKLEKQKRDLEAKVEEMKIVADSKSNKVFLSFLPPSISTSL